MSRCDIPGLSRMMHKEPFSSFLGLLECLFLDSGLPGKKINVYSRATVRPRGEGETQLNPAFSCPWQSARYGSEAILDPPNLPRHQLNTPK